MSEHNPAPWQEAQRLLEELQSNDLKAKLSAATQLEEMGRRTHGPVRTRGAITNPASKLPSNLDLRPAFEAIHDSHWQVRRAVALTLGQWGDTAALNSLEELAENDSEWRVRAAVAEAVSAIGGDRAVEILTKMVKCDPHPSPAEQALIGLNAMMQALQPPLIPAVRTRGSHSGQVIRTRGSISSPPKGRKIEELHSFLEETRILHPDSAVREVGEEAETHRDD